MNKISIDLKKSFSESEINHYGLDKWSFYKITLTEPMVYSAETILKRFPNVEGPVETTIRNIYFIETNDFCSIPAYFASEYFKRSGIRSNALVLIPILEKLVIVPGKEICCCELHRTEEVDDSHYDYSIVQDPVEAGVPLEDLYISCTKTETFFSFLKKKGEEWLLCERTYVSNKPSFFIGYN